MWGCLMTGELTTDTRSTPARLAAKILLDIRAVTISPDKPFTFTSGRLSPVYVDCRRIISYPRARSLLMQMGEDLLYNQVGAEAFDVVAGGETAGIPFAAWISELLGLPMLYVRKQPKGFGKNAQIEGTFKENARVLLVEDLATDGGSKLNFIQAIRDAGGIVEHCFVVFHYGNFPESVTKLKEQGVSLHGLCTWWDILEAAKEKSYTDEELETVRHFLNHPDSWAEKHKSKTTD